MSIQPAGGRVYEFGLPDRLRVSRELAHLGQRELADLTGISRQSVYNYENGVTTPRRPQIVVWAMATGFSVEWLETGKVGPSPSSERRPGIAVTGEYNHIPHRQVIALPVSHLQTAAYSTAASLAMLPGAA